ncbi:uncharacterized protein LOC134836813 isoform X2 [Culicoides brevitarsis]|uniref:uncharacterized protein LOC134836813 isoform X2 n=1 Tax=Culicoides brevitarsis TaxID=469753 RepID=UPI00307C0FC7
MGTEVVTLPASAEDQEEGEIIDVEAYENMELESISSEEEENLKDRIRELETRNKELEKLAAVAKEERRTYNYDNSDFVEISSEEETYFEPKSISNKFYVRMLHPNGRRSNPVSRGKNRRSDVRYKSPDKFRSNVVSPDFKRRRRSMSPEYYQKPRNDHNRERGKNESYRREHKKKKRRNNKRDYSDSESEGERHKRIQLTAAVKRDTRVPTLHADNPLMRKLKLRPGSANKENERYANGDDLEVENVEDTNERDMELEEPEEEDDELIALRLQALKSKAEVKELINEPPAEASSLKEFKSDEFDQEELELRMIALKSAIVKKAVARKKLNEKPYSPTDGLEWTPTSPDNPYASSESNMQISPAISPTLDDAVLQPIDMEIATPDHMSNSPTFYSFDEMKNTPDYNNAWAPFIPMPMLVPVMIPQMVPMMPKTTKNGVPLEFLSKPVRDEVTGSCRSNTQSPCNTGIASESDINSNLRPRSRSLDSLPQSTKEVEEEKMPKDTTTEDDEEQALRNLLLATISPNRQPKKVLPVKETSADTTLDIESDLKRAANRFKELSEHEEELIEASLDKILSKNEIPEQVEAKIEAPIEKKPAVSLKDVVQRLKLSQAKAKLLKVTDVKDELPVEECKESKVEAPVIEESKEIISESLPVVIEEPAKDILSTIDSPKCEKSTQEMPIDNPKSVESPKTLEENAPDSPKPVNSPKIDTFSLPNTPPPPLPKAVMQLKPKQITKAMSSIAAATLNKPKPAQTTKSAPVVIMKRKLKTNSSIINVPFQHKTVAKKAPTSTPNNIPSTSAAILSLEGVIKPVPKVIIRLGESSSSEDSDSSSDCDEEMLMNQSAIASPSHINEINGVASSPAAEEKKDDENIPSKVDSAFESKLDEFLKQARAKTENVSPNKASPGKVTVPKIVQKTPSAVRHLPLSSQIEYKNLLAKMQLLEKQKQSRVKAKPKINLEAGGNIKVTVVNDAPCTEIVPPTKIEDTFEARLAKMSDEAKEKALEKYETSYNDFSNQFDSQLSDFMDRITEATVEKRKQIQLEMEAEELRAKLAAVESQLGHQREKVRKIYPNISAVHKKILATRDKYVKMGKCCVKLGQTVKGTDYQFTSEAKEKIVERLKQLPTKTKQLKNAKEEYLKELEEARNAKSGNNSYQSVLDCMSSTKTGTNDGVLCPFDLSGKCSDKECKYVHLP